MRTACKRIILPLVAIAFTMLMGSCGSTKNVAYLQNSDKVDLSQSQYLYDAKIMPKDQLTITVSTTNDEAAVPFNMTVPTPYTVNSRNTYSQAMLQSYLVGNDGNISFPILGTIHVGGLTKSQAERMIEEKIRPYMAETENPIVTVRMTGYQISVIGEVARPGTFTVAREKISILEALAQAGALRCVAHPLATRRYPSRSAGERTIRQSSMCASWRWLRSICGRG